MKSSDRYVEPTKCRPLPEGWRWARLGEVGTFYSGGTPRKDAEQYWGGTIPFVTGADVTEQWVSAARSHLTQTGLDSGQTHACKRGTVLLVTRTRVGRVGLAAHTLGASQDISPYECGGELLPEYAYWALSARSSQLVIATQGSTILGLTRDYVGNIAISLPPLPVQASLASRLESQMAEVARMRRAAERQLEALDSLPGALLHEVFGGFEPPDE